MTYYMRLENKDELDIHKLFSNSNNTRSLVTEAI